MYKPDCVCIVESWLSSDVFDSEVCIISIYLDCNRRGGGALLFINSVFTHHVVFPGNSELELVTVSIHLLFAC